MTMMKTAADDNRHGRFQVLMELFFREDVEYDQKNVILLEIWQDKLWVYDFQSLREFTVFLHLKLSQFFRRVQSAQVHLQLLDAGIVSGTPRGRDMELLLKLPPEHRLTAWRAVINAAQKHGSSHAVVRRTLAEYSFSMSPPIANRFHS